eukprot:g9413.t1
MLLFKRCKWSRSFHKATSRRPELTSVKSSHVKRLVALHTRKGRYEQGMVLVTSKKIIRTLLQQAVAADSVEACSADAPCPPSTAHAARGRRAMVRALYVGRDDMGNWSWVQDLQNSLPAAPAASAPSFPVLYTTTTEIVRKVTAQVSCEGVFAEVVLPPPDALDWGGARLLVLDALQDPGNTGTLIRTACAMGWQGVVLAGNCCDPFNDKAVSAARGACFFLPLAWLPLKELPMLLSRHGFHICVASADAHSTHPTAAAWEQRRSLRTMPKLALVLGNEHSGISPQLLEQLPARSTSQLHIPLAKQHVASLNVAAAGAVLMQELRQC